MLSLYCKDNIFVVAPLREIQKFKIQRFKIQKCPRQREFGCPQIAFVTSQIDFVKTQIGFVKTQIGFVKTQIQLGTTIIYKE